LVFEEVEEHCLNYYRAIILRLRHANGTAIAIAGEGQSLTTLISKYRYFSSLIEEKKLCVKEQTVSHY
jgi:hypothetical protein